MSEEIDFLLSNPLTVVLLGIAVVCIFFFIRECWKNIKDSQ